MATYKLRKRSYQHEALIITYFKTNIPVDDDDLQELRSEVISQLKNPLDLRGNGDVILLVDASDMTYIIGIIESTKAPYIHRMLKKIEQ